MQRSLNELIESLTELRAELAAKHDVAEDVAGEAAVRIAYQPNYPLECEINTVTALPEREGRGEGDAYVVYIASAAGDTGYAPSAAWEGGIIEDDEDEEDR